MKTALSQVATFRLSSCGYSELVIAETGPTIPVDDPQRFGEPGYFGPWKVSDDPRYALKRQLKDVTCLNVGERVIKK